MPQQGREWAPSPEEIKHEAAKIRARHYLRERLQGLLTRRLREKNHARKVKEKRFAPSKTPSKTAGSAEAMMNEGFTE